ncbi:hypothetical protein SAMN05216359_1282 [Roseateles sp. YR242]|uniref:hypothetical protein n=1 Tax=Roseateles sp. YR242 TaxID=1855305 RepID=UPI0008BFF6E1|nr:hypothetical protein [Roseateles sp. YR242]SEL93290.1 hypothetical protein SAMN05216359_1282 [Roseateles sp. YR242]
MDDALPTPQQVTQRESRLSWRMRRLLAWLLKPQTLIGGILGALLTVGWDVAKLHYGEEFQQYMAAKAKSLDVLQRNPDTVAGNDQAIKEFLRITPSFEDSPRARDFLSTLTGGLVRKLVDQRAALAAQQAKLKAEADEQAKKKAAAEAKAIAEAAEATKKAQALQVAQAAEQAAVQAQLLAAQQQREAEAARRREIQSAQAFDRMLQSPRAR